MAQDNATAHPAADYDELIERTIPYHAAIHAEALRFAAVVQPAPARWLDSGCGTGTLVARALPRFPATRFILADPSSAMLEEARAKIAGAASERVTILPPAGSRDLPGVLDPASRFDVLTAILSHHYLDLAGRREAVAACRKLLAPRGVLITFENVRPADEAALAVAKRYWAAWQVDMGKSTHEAQAHVDRLGREVFPITIEENLSLLREVGFGTCGLLWFSYLQAGFWAIR
jgi:tRNA (cmo5U34)-methyltransferase